MECDNSNKLVVLARTVMARSTIAPDNSNKR